MKNVNLLLAIALIVAASPFASAQDKIEHPDKMDAMAKAGDKSLDQHTFDVLVAETKGANDIFVHLSRSDRSFLKAQIRHRAMKASRMKSDDKMTSGDKMKAEDKMKSDDKMMDEKMKPEGKMTKNEDHYNKIIDSLSDSQKATVNDLIANVAKWYSVHAAMQKNSG